MKQILKISLAIYFSLFIACTPAKEEATFKHPDPETMDENVILPPSWAFGVLYGGYTNQEETIERIQEIQAHDYPIDGYFIDSWFWDYENHGSGPDKYIDFVADTISYPDRVALWSFMEDNNIKGGFWIWDCIQKTGNEEAFEDFKSKGYFSDIHINTGSWHNSNTTTDMYQEGDDSTPQTPTGNIDFKNPEAVAYFKQQIKHFFDEGADFIKLDRTAEISVCKAMFEATQELGKETEGRGFIMSHSSHGTDSEEFKRYPTKWTGDSRGDWSLDKPTKEFFSWVPKHALKENIEAYTDPDNHKSAIPFLTMDMGGFQMGKKVEVSEELFIRWMQFAIFTPITELFTQPENPTSNLPYKYSERADTLFRNYAHLRMQLFPYIYSYAHQTRLTGKNMIQKLPESIHEYTFGKEMIVAPIFTQGATTREIKLPAGNWIHFQSGTKYQGNQSHTVDAPLEEIPVFIKEGAIVPSRKYAPSIEAGNNKTIDLHIFPGSNSSFSLIEDDGTSNDYLEGIYAKTELMLESDSTSSVLTIQPVQGSYKGMPEKRTWNINIHTSSTIKSISLNGEKSSGTNLTKNIFSFNSDVNKLNKIQIKH
ncbi:glycoside hydrolase family 31 protein [Marinilabilia salmonicolor]|uniref:glycoside hydrolase family 31 protein n=1 Tax=Marinilabilia salmonicolor TaxID=989 RepID=UPI00029A6968|nr:TIM-barrel domain-containing protein [Marinilabilia salmonicolor]